MDMVSKLFTFTLTFTTHRPSTRHYRKRSPGVKTHNSNQHSSRARLQHSNHPPSLPTPNRVITGYSQPTQPAAKHRRAEPHYNTDTTSLSGVTISVCVGLHVGCLVGHVHGSA